MINRRFLIIGLVIILGITLVKLGTSLNKEDMALLDEDIELIVSDEQDIEIVEEEGMRKTVLYFKNAEGYLVPVMKKIPWEEGIAKTTLKNMIDSTELRDALTGTGLQTLIPMGT